MNASARKILIGLITNKEFVKRYINMFPKGLFLGEIGASVVEKWCFKYFNKYGDVVLDFMTENTIDLLPGLYYYEIKILRRVPLDESSDSSDSSDEPEFDSVYNTVVPRTKFFIVE